MPVPDKIIAISEFFQIGRVADPLKSEVFSIVMDFFVNFIELVATDDAVVGISPKVGLNQYVSCRGRLFFFETESGLREYLFAQLN